MTAPAAAQEQPPLWTDERIIEFAQAMGHPSIAAAVRIGLLEMRFEYEAILLFDRRQLAAKDAEIDALRRLVQQPAEMSENDFDEMLHKAMSKGETRIPIKTREQPVVQPSPEDVLAAIEVLLESPTDPITHATVRVWLDRAWEQHRPQPQPTRGQE